MIDLSIRKNYAFQTSIGHSSYCRHADRYEQIREAVEAWFDGRQRLPEVLRKTVIRALELAPVRPKPYPADTTAILLKLIHEFDGQQQPIEVSFRKLVPWLKAGERATH